MGIDLELFVHPERISSQLICPICTQVLDNPVQTTTEHLFCEDELLEWMSRSSLCPITKTELDPLSIRKPGRIILNMLGELEMYCKNRPHGCTWTGSREHLGKHLETCECQSKEQIRGELEERDNKIKDLEHQVEELTSRNDELMHENAILTEKIEEYQRRIRVFHALLPQYTTNASNNSGHGDRSMGADDHDVRSFAESLSMLLMDEDEALDLDSSVISHGEDGKESSNSYYYSGDYKEELHNNSRSVHDSRKEISDAERLRRLRGLSSLANQSPPNKFSHK